jgi:hypothetical protein
MRPRRRPAVRLPDQVAPSITFAPGATPVSLRSGPGLHLPRISASSHGFFTRKSRVSGQNLSRIRGKAARSVGRRRDPWEGGAIRGKAARSVEAARAVRRRKPWLVRPGGLLRAQVCADWPLGTGKRSPGMLSPKRVLTIQRDRSGASELGGEVGYKLARGGGDAYTGDCQRPLVAVSYVRSSRRARESGRPTQVN